MKEWIHEEPDASEARVADFYATIHTAYTLGQVEHAEQERVQATRAALPDQRERDALRQRYAPLVRRFADLPPSVQQAIASLEIPGTRRTVEAADQTGETWIRYGDLMPEPSSERTRLHPGAGRPREEHAARGLVLELLKDRAGLTEREAASVATDVFKWFFGQSPGRGTIRTWLQR